ncbi:MAG: dinitrogenase iron-molybdenum cofactor biosynthesis protein [Desulfovibrionaceae bacterium]
MVYCLACYQDRLASVFDTASELRLYHRLGGDIRPAGRLTLVSQDAADRTSALLACGVTHLYCGALPSATRRTLELSGVAVTDWLRGGVDEVVEALRQGSFEHLRMPGAVPPGTAPGAGR